MTWKPSGIRNKNFGAMTNHCDICGKRRGGGNPINHDKCAKLRRERTK